MIAPPCNKCGTRHWSQEDCPADKAKKAPAKPARKPLAEHAASKPGLPANALANKPPEAPLPLANSTKMDDSLANGLANGLANTTSTYKSRDPDKRRAYQRDLMRRKRAQATASPQGAR